MVTVKGKQFDPPKINNVVEDPAPTFGGPIDAEGFNASDVSELEAAAVGTVFAPDWSQNSFFQVEITGPATITFAAPPANGGIELLIDLENGGAHAVTWMATGASVVVEGTVTVGSAHARYVAATNTWYVTGQAPGTQLIVQPDEIPDMWMWCRGDSGIVPGLNQNPCWNRTAGVSDFRAFNNITSAQSAADPNFNNQDVMHITAPIGAALVQSTVTGAWNAMAPRQGTIATVWRMGNATDRVQMYSGLGLGCGAIGGNVNPNLVGNHQSFPIAADANVHMTVHRGIDGGNFEFRYDDLTDTDVVGNNMGFNINPDFGALIGQFNAPGGFYVADYAVWSRRLTDTEVAAFVTYANDRYNLGLTP